MKRIISFIFAFCLAITLFSQEHLKFKGIPIDGPTSSFINKLKAQNFKVVGPSDDGIQQLKGKFTNKDVDLFVVSNNNKVWKVAVCYATQSSWETLYNQYVHLKTLFNQKYGNPVLVDEQTSSLTGVELIELNNGSIKYQILYETNGGTIAIKISPIDPYHGYVSIHYEDSANTQINNESEIDDI